MTGLTQTHPTLAACPLPPTAPCAAAGFEGLKRSQSTQSGERGWRGGGPAQLEPLGSPMARTLSRGRSGDIVRSDIEERQAVATLQAIELVKHATHVSCCWGAAGCRTGALQLVCGLPAVAWKGGMRDEMSMGATGAQLAAAPTPFS